MKLAVVIPVFNEVGLLEAAIGRLEGCALPRDREGAPMDRHLILIDDGSTDGTTEIVKRLGERAGIHAELQPANRGKGAAVRRGIEKAIAMEADLIVIHDADLEYDPADHAVLLAPMVNGRADAVIGSRFLGQTHRVLYFWHYVVNKFITGVSNMLTNLNLSDMECCLKAFTLDVAKRLDLKEEKFGIEPEIVARLAKIRVEDAGVGGVVRSRALRVYEVAVSYAGRTYEEGKKIKWQDGVEAIAVIVKRNLFG